MIGNLLGFDMHCDVVFPDIVPLLPLCANSTMSVAKQGLIQNFLFRRENEALKSALNIERAQMSELNENLRIAEEKEHENETLKSVIEAKEDKIKEYQNEVEGAKTQMQRLEMLVQQVQENAMKSQIANTPLVSIVLRVMLLPEQSET